MLDWPKFAWHLASIVLTDCTSRADSTGDQIKIPKESRFFSSFNMTKGMMTESWYFGSPDITTSWFIYSPKLTKQSMEEAWYFPPST